MIARMTNKAIRETETQAETMHIDSLSINLLRDVKEIQLVLPNHAVRDAG